MSDIEELEELFRRASEEDLSRLAGETLREQRRYEIAKELFISTMLGGDVDSKETLPDRCIGVADWFLDKLEETK